ncbi:MAG TPA: glycoside hydrolase family 97 N-terminal domain-containing protein, partial [Cyclobacteriaceae bacterium]|nr:glycoside hydrolase family 97 N-terminal domain-containing protein [Cyclobacteriaceae bacterium]
MIRTKLLSLYLLAFLVAFSACNPREAKQTSIELSSPEKKVKVDFYLTAEGAPGYVASFNSKIVVDSSQLGFILDSIPSLEKGFEILSSTLTTVDTTWEQPWGEEHFIRDNHNELKIELIESQGEKRRMNIVFRAFDYGLGFRYEFPEQDKLANFKIMDELTEFNLADNDSAWWIPAYQGNRYEFIPHKDAVSDLKFVHTPLTIEGNGYYLSIHEAALVDFASMVIQGEGNNKLKCDLVPWKNGVRTYVTQSNRVTPWRTIQLAETPGDLITSYLILNLNEPNKIGDVSWIKPGKYVGVWWEMHLNIGTWHQGPKHAANTANTKRYIDFAARHGFDGVLVEGWNYGWDGNWANGGTKFNFTKPYPDYDIDYLSKYGKEKGVYIIGHHE